MLSRRLRHLLTPRFRIPYISNNHRPVARERVRWRVHLSDSHAPRGNPSVSKLECLDEDRRKTNKYELRVSRTSEVQEGLITWLAFGLASVPPV